MFKEKGLNLYQIFVIKPSGDWLDTSVGSEPKFGLAQFWLELLGKKARLGSPYLEKKARFSLACSMI